MEEIDFINEALKQAKVAEKKLEIPVGAIIVKDNKIIARGYNQKESKNNCTNHAEIIAIEKANKKLKNWRLSDCEMYVTLEPCPMCAGAISESRIKKIFIGTRDNNYGSCGTVINLVNNDKIKRKSEVIFLDNKECEKIIKDFFVKIRKKQ